MNMHVETPDTEPTIVMSRTFAAPRDVVWTAFTDPKHVSKWYGGHGFSSPVCEMDVRTGGRWRHTMRTPDGTDFAMEFVYVEVVKPSKLVWKNASPMNGRQGMADVTNTVTLEDAGAQTKWTLVARFTSMAERDRARSMGFARVITQGAEKLDDLVRALSSATQVAS
jgi:uncharacterized protein YndB with AHSA1/START domain